MKKLKQIIAAVIAVIITVAAIPTALWVSGAENVSSGNIIWEATPDLFLAGSDGTVNATFASGSGEWKYSVYRKTEPNGAYYSAAFTEADNGSTANYAAAKGAYNDKSENFGWLNSKAVLSAIAPYLYVTFDYRVTGTEVLPADTTLTLNAAQAYSPDICTLAQVNVSDAAEWKAYPLTKVKDTSFSMPWYSGFVSFNLTSGTGGLSGTQTVDLKNITLVIKDSDRTAINNKLKVISNINGIPNFTQNTLIQRNNYFGLLTLYDKYSALSTKGGADSYTLNIETNELCDIAVSRTRYIGSEDVNLADSVTVSVKPTMGYNIKSVTAVTEDGTTVTAEVTEKNSKYILESMPTGNVTIKAELVVEKIRDLAFLWRNDPGTHNTNPWYSNSGGKWTTVDGGNQSAYQFTLTKNQGVVYVYGTKNQNITLERYFDTAYFYTSIKLDTELEDRTVKIGVSGSMYYEAVIPETEEWTLVKIPLKDIATTPAFSSFKIDLTNRQAGDVITVGETFVFSKEIEGTIDEAWAQIYDISHYEKSETNTLLGVIGDTEGMVDPWVENGNTIGPDGEKIETVVGWDIAWYYSFQNMAPYILLPKEDKMGLPYFTTFYGEKTINVSDYVDTGYMEFFIYSDVDGLEVPFSLESTGHTSRTFASFSVIYDKSKAREDGYMRVRIPFTYFSDAGLNMDKLVRVTIKGTQTSLYCDYFLISSFRFYDKLADVPEPEPIKEPEPEPERDLPLELNGTVINAQLDKENKILYVPGDTKIWEILSAITLDTEETNIDFYNGEFIEDDETVVDESMEMVLYRRGYFLDQFEIKLLTTETTTTNVVTVELENEEDTVLEDTVEYEDIIEDEVISESEDEVISDEEDTTEDEVISDSEDTTEETVVSQEEKTTENKVTPKEPKNEFPWVIIVLAAVLAVALVSATVIIIIKRKNRRTK